jgi:hypothetical protein
MKTNTYAVPEGCKITSVDFEKGVVVFESNEPKFKKGDFLATSSCIIIFKNESCGYERHFLSLRKINNSLADISLDYGWGNISDFRLATPEEKNLLVSKMRENGKDWDEEKCEVVDYVEMIEIGKEFYSIFYDYPDKKYKYRKFVYASLSKRYYEKDDFKTEQLAQAACDELNKVLTTLKHY